MTERTEEETKIEAVSRLLDDLEFEVKFEGVANDPSRDEAGEEDSDGAE